MKAANRPASIALASMLLLLALLRSASAASDFTEEEWALLPSWCANTMADDGQRGPRRLPEMLARYGGDFNHMHHYCWGVVQEMRSSNSRLPGHLQRTNAAGAVGNYDYVLRNTQPGFVFRLDTLRRKAGVLQRSGQMDKAIAAAQQAIKEFPTEPEGYIAAAFVYLAAKRRDLAEQVLTAGAEQVTDKDRLQRAREVLLRP